MTKQDFIERWVRNEETIEAMESDIDQVIALAIAEHEQAKWKKYPKDKPDEMTLYLCQCKTEVWDSRKKYTNPYGFGYWVFSGWQIINDNELEIIAFRELPKPYQEGGEG